VTALKRDNTLSLQTHLKISGRDDADGLEEFSGICMDTK
jgi:hypothetical protein